MKVFGATHNPRLGWESNDCVPQFPLWISAAISVNCLIKWTEAVRWSWRYPVPWTPAPPADLAPDQGGSGVSEGMKSRKVCAFQALIRKLQPCVHSMNTLLFSLHSRLNEVNKLESLLPSLTPSLLLCFLLHLSLPTSLHSWARTPPPPLHS